jgi:hypothetical protein
VRLQQRLNDVALLARGWRACGVGDLRIYTQGT